MATFHHFPRVFKPQEGADGQFLSNDALVESVALGPLCFFIGLLTFNPVCLFKFTSISITLAKVQIP